MLGGSKRVDDQGFRGAGFSNPLSNQLSHALNGGTDPGFNGRPDRVSVLGFQFEPWHRRNAGQCPELIAGRRANGKAAVSYDELGEDVVVFR